MAPDLNALNSNGRWDYSTPGSSGYNIPDITYDDPQARKLKVLTIGAGFSGILMAYQIQKQCQNVELVIYEKNEDIGGTWLENRYPGCACDIPSHAYTYNFALNPDWPRFFSYSPDIWKYLDKVCETFGLRKYMTFNTQVLGAYWQEEQGQWKVKLRQTKPDGGEPREFEETCDLLLYATGILNDFKMPDIPGMEKFKGRIVHTARWPKDYHKEEWKNERVAVIGSGASSIQTVPNMQPHVKHMDVFVRTGVWFVQIANNYGANHEYTQEQKDGFRKDVKTMVAHAKDIENQVNGLFSLMYSGSEAQVEGQKAMKARMAEFIKDKRLLEGFTPKWEIGCRRVTPGDPYMLAIQEKNVDVHFTHVAEITEDGCVGGDGVERKVDTIVCATGFDVTYRPRFPVIGRNGVNLKEKWETCPEAYLGLAVPDMPNFVMYIGPTWPVENGSVAGPLLSVSEYTISLIKKMQRDHIKSWVPRQDITDQFNEHAQARLQLYPRGSDIDKRPGRKVSVQFALFDACGLFGDFLARPSVWPGSSLHYIRAIDSPRYEDFEIQYLNKNPWAFLGMGYAMEDKVPGSDISPYLQYENIDPKWLETIGHSKVETVPREEIVENLGEAVQGGLDDKA